MKFNEIKCSKCDGTLDPESIIILRTNIKNDNDPDASESTKLCKTEDNLFIKGKCAKCGETVHALVALDVKQTKSVSKDNFSSLCMIDA